MDASVKNLTITGVAASLGAGGAMGDTVKPRRKRGVTRKKWDEPLEGGDEEVTEEYVAPVKATISKIMPPETPPHVKLPQLQVRPTQVYAPQVKTIQTEAVKAPQVQAPLAATRPPLLNTGTQKVNLIPPKSQRVKLNPKVLGAHISSQNHTRSLQTRKARRVIVPNLSARFTRAKKLRDETEKSSIDTIRNYLIEKGVIQSKSRAPEKMLRSMYNDFNLLKDGQAL